MSGHSHYATIKRQKGLKDAVKGKIFSKLGRAISIAVKTGGGMDPNANYKLRMAVDAARAENMPKDNIERAITRAGAEASNVEEIAYEGFGPGGVGIIIEAATDNKNRTSQEIKNIFDKSGGNMGGPGSVAFNFEAKGFLMIKKAADVDSQMLALIDLGVDDLSESSDGIEIYVHSDKLYETREKLIAGGFEIISMELTRRPINHIEITDPSLANRVLKLLDNLEEYDDVQKVYANLDVSDEIIKSANLN